MDNKNEFIAQKISDLNTFGATKVKNEEEKKVVIDLLVAQNVSFEIENIEGYYKYKFHIQ